MSVDSQAVISAVSGLDLSGNEEGLIPAFGLYLTRHYANYYNRVSYAYLHAAEAEGAEPTTRARTSLVKAGEVCGFNTFGGIMLSQEWDAVVQPMIECREDWVHGITAVINCLGWGVWSVESIDPRRLHMKVRDSYESVGYMRDHAKRSDGICFLATGGVSSIMNLLYNGDITRRPALTPAYFETVFGAPHRFAAREVACRAAGAPCCEFIAEHVHP